MDNHLRAHVSIRFLPALTVEFPLYKLKSAKCITIMSINTLCLTLGPHHADWLQMHHQPFLGLAPRATHVSLRLTSVCLWSLPSLGPPTHTCFSP